MYKLLMLFLISVFTYFIWPKDIFAHPLDEIGDIKTYDQKQIIEVSRDKVRLTIDLTLYALDKIKVWESIDKNRDRELTSAEKDEWMSKGQQASWLEIKGLAASLAEGVRINFNASGLTFPDYYDFFSPDKTRVVIEFLADSTTSPNQQIIYHYEGKDQKLDEIEFIAKGTNGTRVEKLAKIDSSSVSFNVVAGRESQEEVLGMTSSTKLDEFLDKYVKSDNLPLPFIILAFASAFLIGALHALTPGHGKAMVAGYLVGSRGKVIHAIYLGLIITATHTSVVFILGFLALFATVYFVPTQVIKSLTFFSGFLVFAFGLYLVYKRGMRLFKNPQNNHHDHDHNGHKREITWKSLLPLGLSGGLIPCVDALAILIVAISLDKIFWGVVLLIIFSVGLASALTGAGILAVVAKEKITSKFSSVNKFEPIISLASAVVVTVLGLGLMLTG